MHIEDTLPCYFHFSFAIHGHLQSFHLNSCDNVLEKATSVPIRTFLYSFLTASMRFLLPLSIRFFLFILML